MLDKLLIVGATAGAIASIFTLFKYIIPAIKHGIGVNRNTSRIEALEKGQKVIVESIQEMRDESKLSDRLLVCAMIAMVDSRITGNNIEKLEEQKNKLMFFLEKH